MNFAQRFEQGKAGESAIASWLMKGGWSVLPVYEKIIDEGKGPQLFQARHSFIAPDLFVLRPSDEPGHPEGCWIEAKHKQAFTWYRMKQVFETGIDKRHWEHYCKLRDSIGLPVELLFLHRGGQAKDSPKSPAGLFGAEIMELQRNISHESDKWGTSGMIYWTREQDGGPLRYLASYEEVMSCASRRR